MRILSVNTMLASVAVSHNRYSATLRWWFEMNLFKIDDRDKGQTQVTGGGADENDENES